MFNTIRPKQAPASLAQHKSWTGTDVIFALREMFFDKCYICETKDPLSLNVEHFDAHQGDDTKKYDWNNLYFACTRCNRLKGLNHLLDCTDPETDVLRSIRHVVPTMPDSNIVIEAKNQNPKTLETSELIDKVFNGKNTGNQRLASVYLRERVFKRYVKFLKYVNIYFDEDSLPKAKKDAFEDLKHMMRKEMEYSAFIRWTVLDSPIFKKLLEAYID